MDKDYIIGLKAEYNNYLLRHCKACVYLEDEQVPMADREKWLPQYKVILSNLNRILDTLDIYNISYSVSDVLSGFDICEELKNVG
jgi:hypothetical protein